jgi:hypothetical protein
MREKTQTSLRKSVLSEFLFGLSMKQDDHSIEEESGGTIALLLLIFFVDVPAAGGFLPVFSTR